MNKQNEYQARRQALAQHLPTSAIALIPAASETIRSADSHFRFRQDSDFYYFTGFNEPEALLLVTSGKNSRSILFNQSKDRTQEIWTGFRLGQEAAPETLAVDEAYPIEMLQQKLPDLLAGHEAIYFPMGRYPHFDKIIQESWMHLKHQLRRGIAAAEIFADLSPISSEMRLFKSESEVARMQKAASISVEAHKRAMRAAKKADFEYQLEAELIYEFCRHGSRSPAYDSIVAGGNNACVLHYTANNQKLREGDLILIDAGAEYDNYAADITRCFPKNGRFSKEQELLYNLVLKAQQAGIAEVKPGTTWNRIQETIVQVLVDGLIDLKILRGSPDEIIETQAYRAFYMHNSGHWLGLDVHDCGRYKIQNQWRELSTNMVLTVEPGLYIAEDAENVPAGFRGIGIRIEDDILVHSEGHQNLSAGLAVEIADIEALIRD